MFTTTKDTKNKSDFRKITISLASPESILNRSKGEVTKPETINYRSYKPEMGGLFCERIFGPVKDYECHCGKYKRVRYKGIICDRCGVEVTEKKVRRERMGHIQLVIPVAHIWYFRSQPNKIGNLLGWNSKKLDQVIYYERYVVINPGTIQHLSKGDFLTESEYEEILQSLPRDNYLREDNDPEKFVAKMGAEAIQMLLQTLDLDSIAYDLRAQVSSETSQQRKTEALKRLKVIEAFRSANRNKENKPEWMLVTMVPVIPPDLRPLVPLEGGRFAASDLNDLYRRIIIRNNRLKKLIEVSAPDVILRNEKRMLQEAVDSLFDNTRKANAVKTESNRVLKSLSDMLKGKAGRFRQNLLGKRVDYSGRSVIVVGPELKLHECGLPKDMAAELFKPFIIRKLLERGIAKTVKTAKKIVDKKEAVIWEILENVLKGHPVLLNRAPTLHRLGIQAFQPKLIEGKAIQLHPLVCTGFNADFDGDQMAVHVPLSNEACLEAMVLMLSSHNILHPANGAPIALPSQDMVLGIYYMTKERPNQKGENLTFYSPEEVIIAYNEGKVALHAKIKVRINKFDDKAQPIIDERTGIIKTEIIETTVGRVLFNQIVPKEMGFVNTLLTKTSARKIIQDIFRKSGLKRTVEFLDDLKQMGFQFAFKGGLSFNLKNVLIPKEKQDIIADAYSKIEEITMNYEMGLITDNERYNQVIDTWGLANTQLAAKVLSVIKNDQDGFNSVYMMLDSGARGSKEQIRQLGGMRGLMAKPQKTLKGGSGEIIENPILSNFREGLTVLEYFISTHGARKGLADTALKTADAGYLTRRLVDVAQDVIIKEDDCGTLRGINITSIIQNDELVEHLSDRIIGRTPLNDIYHPITDELIVKAGDEITEEIAEKIKLADIESVEIRSVLTCDAKEGVCAKCYGRNLANGRMVQMGEAVGVIAAQSIGEPGTQLTLRTFHTGGAANRLTADSSLKSKYKSKVVFENIKTAKVTDEKGIVNTVVIGRSGEIKLVDLNNPDKIFKVHNIPYAATLFVTDGQEIEKDTLICSWEAYNSLILSEFNGKVEFENIVNGLTAKTERDVQTGKERIIIVESRDKSSASIRIVDKNGETIKIYNLPINSHLEVDNNEEVVAGQILAKIPRNAGRTSDITGGLPRVQELFEARNPSNPAVIAEIDGYIQFGKEKRGNREVYIIPKQYKELLDSGELTLASLDLKPYLASKSKHFLVQDNDYVIAGEPLTDGAITPADILRIKGSAAVQEYIVNEIQEVYRLQGVKINDKHIEVIVRQMMQKVTIKDSGDTTFLEKEIVDKIEFQEENDWIFDKKVIEDAGDSETLVKGMIVPSRKVRDENSMLKRKGLRLVQYRDARPAIGIPTLQGITRASLGTQSFMSAASFQETTKVLSEAAVLAKTDNLNGLKENVIVGHLIPAGTGLRQYESIEIISKDTPSEPMIPISSTTKTKKKSKLEV